MARTLPWAFRRFVWRQVIAEALGLGRRTTAGAAWASSERIGTYATADAFYADLPNLRALSWSIVGTRIAESARFFDEALYAAVLRVDPDLAPLMVANPHLSSEGAAWLTAWCCRYLHAHEAAIRHRRRDSGWAVPAERTERRAARTLARLVKDDRARFSPSVVAALQIALSNPHPSGWGEVHNLLLERRDTPAALLDCLAPSPTGQPDNAVLTVSLLDHPNGGPRFWPVFRAIYERRAHDADITSSERDAVLPALVRSAPREHFPHYWRALWAVWPERAMELLVERAPEDLQRLALTPAEIGAMLQAASAAARLGAVMALSVAGVPAEPAEVPRPDPREPALATVSSPDAPTRAVDGRRIIRAR